MNYKKYILKDIANIKISGVDKKTIEGEKEVRLCNFVDVYKNWSIDSSMYDSFMVATANDREIESFTIKEGQVAITKDSETRDDIGISTYISSDFERPVVLGYHTALITPKEEILDGKYLNALLHSKYFADYWYNNASGSGMRYTLSESCINYAPIYLPEIEHQRQIGSFLEYVDKKIRLNQNMNCILEKIAKQLYDYWFVQFDFPDKNGRPYKSSGGKMVYNEKLKRGIPEGWEVKSIGSILSDYKHTIKFGTKDYLEKGKFPIIDQGSAYIVGYTNDNNNLLDYPAVLFGDHSTNVKFINFPFARGADGTQILYSNTERIKPYYLYLYVASLPIPNPGYSRHFKYLKEMPIIIPDVSTSDEYQDKVFSLYSKWTENVIENIKLSDFRDFLLPMLMNGQIKIK